MTRKKQRTPGGRGAVAVEQTAGPAPKLPHERDESTDGMQDGPRERMRQAHDDVVQGRRDTSRGEVSDSTYHKLRK
jgi:hypothetical protein